MSFSFSRIFDCGNSRARQPAIIEPLTTITTNQIQKPVTEPVIEQLDKHDEKPAEVVKPITPKSPHPTQEEIEAKKKQELEAYRI